ncbi:MAG: hypothetical protein ACT6FF_02205, partial [Methanosarcinaceae archaeon]
RNIIKLLRNIKKTRLRLYTFKVITGIADFFLAFVTLADCPDQTSKFFHIVLLTPPIPLLLISATVGSLRMEGVAFLQFKI